MVDMEMTMTLAEHLAALNAEKQAWIDAGPDRWAGFYTEDLSHWAEMGIHTVTDFQRYELQSIIWDMYKDVTGIRPRHMDFDSMSLEDLQREVDYLGSQMQASIEADARWEAEEEAYRIEQEAERAAWLAEQPEPIDYLACKHQEGWL
jgi:hypothetical protein